MVYYPITAIIIANKKYSHTSDFDEYISNNRVYRSMQIFAFSEQQCNDEGKLETTDRFNVFVIILILMNLRAYT